MLSTRTFKVFFLITTLAFGCLLMVGYYRLARAHGGGATADCPYPPDIVRVERVRYGDPNASDYITDHVESEYIVGVLIGELRNHFMPWHLEAARAQAIAARTYATYHCKKRQLQDGT